MFLSSLGKLILATAVMSSQICSAKDDGLTIDSKDDALNINSKIDDRFLDFGSVKIGTSKLSDLRKTFGGKIYDITEDGIPIKILCFIDQTKTLFLIESSIMGFPDTVTGVSMARKSSNYAHLNKCAPIQNPKRISSKAGLSLGLSKKNVSDILKISPSMIKDQTKIFYNSKDPVNDGEVLSTINLNLDNSRLSRFEIYHVISF